MAQAQRVDFITKPTKIMLLSELKAKLKDNTITEQERVNHCQNLFKHLTPISMRTIQTFQAGWDRAKGMEAFFTQLHKELYECIAIEQSEMGLIVREQFGKGELLDTLEL